MIFHTSFCLVSSMSLALTSGGHLIPSAIMLFMLAWTYANLLSRSDIHIKLVMLSGSLISTGLIPSGISLDIISGYLGFALS